MASIEMKVAAIDSSRIYDHSKTRQWTTKGLKMRKVSKKNSVRIRNTGSQALRAVTVAVGMSGQRNKSSGEMKAIASVIRDSDAMMQAALI